MSISLIDGGAELFDRVEPLWNALRAHHAAASERFGDELRALDFSQRRLGLVKKAASGPRVALAQLGAEDVGYAIALIDVCGEGHVESLFVHERCRGQRIGEALLKRQLEWLENSGARTISLEVLVGNERALRFYERLGFHPRTYRLRRCP